MDLDAQGKIRPVSWAEGRGILASMALKLQEWMQLSRKGDEVGVFGETDYEEEKH